ncbi:hypothetical protein GCM10010987_61540 [Bradyrhizobium guangdongense]|uniref:Uncharacterized protein n=1 Tax=Bradyrhizobium guangdongense TaxID=1325090 RepID=A0AA87W8X7_9BRAD|nr:hypothetical protein GCM10010987_61540 [Bradyrhizobium guangdongense]
MLSIARQFGSAAKAAGVNMPSTDASKNAAVHVPVRTILTLDTPWLFGFARPGGALARPGRKSIPFGPTHSALLTSDPHENKGRIVPAGLRTNEDCRNPISVPDDCRVCHFGLPFGLN